MTTFYPASTVGIIGGGQLGRLTAMAARAMGYRVYALDPDPDCPARGVVDVCVTAAFDDIRAFEAFAQAVDVVTFEIEKVGIPALRAAALQKPVRPSPDLLAIIQDRALQRQWLAQHKFPQGPFSVADDAMSVEVACALFGFDAFVKTRVGGYDGRGQSRVTSAETAASAFQQCGDVGCVVEKALPLQAELSVMVVRRPSGEIAVFPPALNHHEQRILAWSAMPAPLDAALLAEAQAIGRDIAAAIGLEGVLAIELFVVDGKLLVNELAPRPHNSFHATERACLTSQFEQHVRAVCDLPLGATDLVIPTAISNVLGDMYFDSGGIECTPNFAAALAIPGVRLHLYGKSEARRGRKMGHLSAVGKTPEEAAETAQRAERALVQASS